MLVESDQATLRIERTVIFAPNGTDPGLSAEVNAKEFFWKGVSFSAWSDASFFHCLPVAVYGEGLRALEQAVTTGAVHGSGDAFVSSGPVQPRSAPAIPTDSPCAIPRLEPASRFRDFSQDGMESWAP